MTSSSENLTEIELLRAQLAEQEQLIQSQSERIKILKEVVVISSAQCNMVFNHIIRS